MPKKRKTNPKSNTTDPTDAYRYPASELLLRPEVGTQAQFRQKRPATKYRYDDSLSPSMEWDGENSVRELGGGARGGPIARVRCRTGVEQPLPD